MLAVCGNPLAVVLTSSTSFASSQARKLIRSAARPLPTEIASLDFGGGPSGPSPPCRGRPDEGAGECVDMNDVLILPCRPFHHALRAWSPFPYRDGSVAFDSLRAALRAASTPPPRRFAARSPSPCRGGSGAARPQTLPCGQRRVIRNLQVGAMADCSSCEIIFIASQSALHVLTPPKAAFEAGFAGRTSPARGGGPSAQADGGGVDTGGQSPRLSRCTRFEVSSGRPLKGGDGPRPQAVARGCAPGARAELPQRPDKPVLFRSLVRAPAG